MIQSVTHQYPPTRFFNQDRLQIRWENTKFKTYTLVIPPVVSDVKAAFRFYLSAAQQPQQQEDQPKAVPKKPQESGF